MTDDFFEVELYAAGIYPRLKFIPKENEGATEEEVLKPRSRFQKILFVLDKSKYYARFIVLPDSYEVYLAARAISDQAGLLSGWDEQTKLMPSFLIGKRSVDNARRFMSDVAKRLARPAPHTSDAHAFAKGGYRAIVQISTDGWAGYPEAVDLAFGPYAKYGTIIKEYRNATMQYTPSEMVGAKRTGIRGIEGRALRTIGTSHVERLNGTQRLFMKRLNRLTLCFSKKLENLEAAFGMFAAYYQLLLANAIPGQERKGWHEATERRYDGEVVWPRFGASTRCWPLDSLRARSQRGTMKKPRAANSGLSVLSRWPV